LGDSGDNIQPERGHGFPQILHDRARIAAEELHKLILSLSCGGVGVFFVSLTNKENALSLPQKITVVSGVVFMSLAALSGIACWYADARRKYFWAIALQTEEKRKQSASYQARDRWLRIENGTARVLIWCFSAGIIASTIYLTLRVMGI
jgi:hypothetical protein